jgi:glycosyltransferase involved in cell wall biosynthesis
MPVYSIILPVRNGGHYVKECVQSILQQSLDGFELIVLDNCSTDGTAEWIESLKDRRITIYRADRPLGIEENWARIKDIPKSEFMTMIGHDDVLLPHYLSVMDGLIKKHPTASLYQSHFSYIDAEGRFLRHCLPMDEMQYAHEFLACHCRQIINNMGTGYMMRSSDYDKVGGIPTRYPGLLFADYELWIRLSQLSYKATSQELCFNYRIHQSVSRTTSGIPYQQAFLLYTGFLEEMVKKDANIAHTVRLYGNDLLLYYCESLSHRMMKTDPVKRSLNVSDFINKCREAAGRLGLSDVFTPEKVKRIKWAVQIDSNILTRWSFHTYKRMF